MWPERVGATDIRTEFYIGTDGVPSCPPAKASSRSPGPAPLPKGPPGVGADFKKVAEPSKLVYHSLVDP